MNKFSSVRKKTEIFIAAILLATGLGGVVWAKPLRELNGAVTGNKHDFSKDNTTAPIHSSNENRVCIFCHTPHGASAQSTLWNRPSPLGAGAFNLNGSLSLVIKGTAKAASEYDNADTSSYPNGSTRLCMSCHDGVVAIGAVLNGTIADGDTILDAYVGDVNPNMVIDLATSHPVSFKYDPAVVTEINNIKGANQYRLPLLTDVPLDGNNRMQCTTCHDPHEDTRITDPSQPPFWRHVVAGFPNLSYDEVCSTCHFGDPFPGVGTNH